MKGRVYIVGVGPGSPDWVGKGALKLIKSADIIVGWEMDARPVAEAVRGKRVFLQEVHNYLKAPVQAAEEAAKSGATVAVLKTGDPLVAPAGLVDLQQVFEGFDIRVIPAISTVQLAAATAGVSLEDSAIITYHPTPHDGGSDLRKKRRRMLSALAEGRNLIVLTGVRQMPDQTASYLLSKEANPDLPAFVCEKLGQPEQNVRYYRLDDVAAATFDWQSVMVVKSSI